MRVLGSTTRAHAPRQCSEQVPVRLRTRHVAPHRPAGLWAKTRCATKHVPTTGHPARGTSQPAGCCRSPRHPIHHARHTAVEKLWQAEPGNGYEEGDLAQCRGRGGRRLAGDWGSEHRDQHHEFLMTRRESLPEYRTAATPQGHCRGRQRFNARLGHSVASPPSPRPWRGRRFRGARRSVR